MQVKANIEQTELMRWEGEVVNHKLIQLQPGYCHLMRKI